MELILINSTLMAAREAARTAIKNVRPILSIDSSEAKKRVLNLYKAWYRQMPYVVMDYDIPKSVPQLRQKLREEFEKNTHITDIRVIDMLVIKGQMELKETVEIWKQKENLEEMKLYYIGEKMGKLPQLYLADSNPIYCKLDNFDHVTTKVGILKRFQLLRIFKYLKNILLAGAAVDPTAETPLSWVPPSILGCSSLR
uniref:NADH dehydrogenase [ubiquinone] 1 alpha subcomplex subunit 6 n=1 Tax=Timema cristinae TaxID=61476 RepID=A0A7R9D3K5_TIMCR|nr:unnamed protein product [Timema cristinae]